MNQTTQNVKGKAEIDAAKAQISASQAQIHSQLDAADREQAAQEEEPARRPLLIDASQHLAIDFINERPKDPDLLHDGCPKRSVQGLVASPGTGKSIFSSQYIAAIASGVEFFGLWKIVRPGRCLFLSVEDDHSIVQQRVYDAIHGLPEELQRQAAKNICVPPIYGHVNLFDVENGRITPGLNYRDMQATVRKYKPDLIIFDTLSRFAGGVEGDNSIMSEACSYLEEVCNDCNTNVLVVHHTSKNSGGLCATSDSELFTMLDAYAARGASALTASVRWQMNLAPLEAKYAVKIIGDNARGYADGTYVAGRVSKKNYGPSEPRFFLKHNPINGLFEKVEPLASVREKQNIQDDALDIVNAVRARKEAGGQPYAVTRIGQDVFGWGPARATAAIGYAEAQGRLEIVKKDKGKGQVLKLLEPM